jgi:hypothetical protein
MSRNTAMIWYQKVNVIVQNTVSLLWKHLSWQLNFEMFCCEAPHLGRGQGCQEGEARGRGAVCDGSQ